MDEQQIVKELVVFIAAFEETEKHVKSKKEKIPLILTIHLKKLELMQRFLEAELDESSFKKAMMIQNALVEDVKGMIAVI